MKNNLNSGKMDDLLSKARIICENALETAIEKYNNHENTPTLDIKEVKSDVYDNKTIIDIKSSKEVIFRNKLTYISDNLLILDKIQRICSYEGLQSDDRETFWRE